MAQPAAPCFSTRPLPASLLLTNSHLRATTLTVGWGQVFKFPAWTDPVFSRGGEGTVGREKQGCGLDRLPCPCPAAVEGI